MRITVNAADLSAAVKITATAVNTRPNLPVLAGVKVTAAEDHIALVSFDFDAAARARAGAVGHTPGETLVSHRLLASIVTAIKSGDVTLDDSDGPLVVTSGRAVWRLPRMPIADYPTVPAAGDVFATVDAVDFARAVDAVAQAAGDEPTANLDSVYLRTDDGALTLAGCNRHRLHVAEVAATVTGEPAPFLLIPARRLTAMTKHLNAGQVQLRASSTLFGMSNGDAALSTRLTEPEGGQWIKFEPLLASADDDPKVTVTLDRDDLLGALRQVAGFASEATKGARLISLTFDRSGELTVVAGTDAEGSGSTVIDTEHSGPGIRLTVNVQYLTDAVATIDSPAVRLTFKSPKHPIGVGGEGQPASAVCMPISMPGAGAWVEDEAAVAV